jgi:hypothetical protein
LYHRLELDTNKKERINMSHNIEKRDKQFGLEMAWHSLTQIVEKILPHIAFPWGIQLEQIYYGTGPGQRQHGKWVLPIADDDRLPLGSGVPVNLSTYTIRTPLDLWQLRDEVVAGTENTVVSAGTVENRAKFFISTKLNELERIKVADGSEVELLLNSMGSLDKSLNEQHSISSTRIVCANTLMMSFLSDKVKFRYRHSKNMNDAIKADKPLMQEVAGLAAVVKAAFDDLVVKPCDVDRATRIYTGLVASPEQKEVSTRAANIVEEHVECFQRGQGNVGKSEFDLLNGWTQLKTRGYEDSKKSRWDTFATSEFGAYSDQKVRLANLLINDRDGLNKVEARGRSLMEIEPIVVSI